MPVANITPNSRAVHKDTRVPGPPQFCPKFYVYLGYGKDTVDLRYAKGKKYPCSGYKFIMEKTSVGVSVEMRTLMTSFFLGAACAAVLLTATGNSNLANAQSATVCDCLLNNETHTGVPYSQQAGR